ncbi:MAG: hydantoinase/oxoprolinase N-terminal domain-containing protein, partial [Spirochaetia bacterium]
MDKSGHFFLGIDTGGTYTDSVLFSEESGVVASAKAITTRRDLSIGIRES